MRKQTADYDKRLLAYITNYVRQNNVPPSLDSMIENVQGVTSKSTLFIHLQNLKNDGLLTQKNAKGYYYPTSIDIDEVSVPKYLIQEVCKRLQSPKDKTLVDKLSNYLIQRGD